MIFTTSTVGFARTSLLLCTSLVWQSGCGHDSDDSRLSAHDKEYRQAVDDIKATIEILDPDSTVEVSLRGAYERALATLSDRVSGEVLDPFIISASLYEWEDNFRLVYDWVAVGSRPVGLVLYDEDGDIIAKCDLEVNSNSGESTAAFAASAYRQGTVSIIVGNTGLMPNVSNKLSIDLVPFTSIQTVAISMDDGFRTEHVSVDRISLE